QFSGEQLKRLQTLRDLVQKFAPAAIEGIFYGMPGYKTFGKPLIYFAGYTAHTGLYATPSGHEKFEKELSSYVQGKGSVQFPIKEEFPIDLIGRIIQFRVEENKQKYSK